MLVLGAALLIARTIYLNSVPASASADVAAAAFDILVRFIKTGLRTLLVVGLVVAAGAFFTGPSVTAVRTRSALSSGLGRLHHGGESGPASQWTYAHRTALRIGAVALAAILFVFWGQPTAAVVVAIAVLLLVVLGLIEVIGRPPAQPSPAPHAPHGRAMPLVAADLLRSVVVAPTLDNVLVLGLIVAIRMFLSFSLEPRSRASRRGDVPWRIPVFPRSRAMI
jgi:hypothetical protein